MDDKSRKNVKFLKSFTCPSCGGQITLRTGAHALSAVCAHCSSVIDTSNEALRIIQEMSVKKYPITIPIGTRGVLKDVAWEVIGHLQKCDKSGQYYWEEYLLFNPYQGFRFLIMSQGHWNFAEPVRSYMGNPRHQSTIWEGMRKYKKFLRDTPKVTRVQGEFYWRVAKGEQAETYDFISPPYMLSFEISSGDVVVSRCTYLERKDVQDAFGIDSMAMPLKPRGVFANQPYKGKPKRTALMALLACAAALAVHFAVMSSSAKELVFTVGNAFGTAERGKSFVAPKPIVIEYPQNLLIDNNAGVSNEWAEMTIELTERTSGKSYSVLQGMEYYFGYSGGESWSEGSATESDYISSIEPGVYDVVYEVDSGVFGSLGSAPNGLHMTFNTQMRRDVPSVGNLMWTWFLLLCYPIGLWWHHNNFETRRWNESDV